MLVRLLIMSRILPINICFLDWLGNEHKLMEDAAENIERNEINLSPLYFALFVFYDLCKLTCDIIYTAN